MAKEAASIFVRLSLKARDFEKDLNRKARSLRRFTTNVQAAGLGATALAAPLAAAGAAAVRVAGNLDAALTRSTSISKDFADRLPELESAAREMSKETGIAAESVAEGFFFLASAGKDAEQSLAALGPVARFAVAGQFDLATATDLATDAQSALGLTSSDAEKDLANLVRVTDTLVEANTLANATTQQFSEALTNKAGAAIKSVGKDIEEGVAVLAALADQGVKGVDAGTKLGIVFRDLQTKSIQNRAAFKSLGIEVFDSTGDMRNLADVVGDVETALAGMSDEQQKATLLQLGFADKSVSTLQALLGTSEAIRDYEKRMREMSGTTQEVSDRVLEGFNKQMAKLKAEIVDAGIELGKALMPELRQFANFLTKSVIPGAKEAIQAFAGWGSEVKVATAAMLALGPALVAGAFALNAVLSATLAVAAATAAMPVAAATLAIGALTTAIITYATGVDEGREKTEGFDKAIRDANENYVIFRENLGDPKFDAAIKKIRDMKDGLMALEAELAAAKLAHDKEKQAIFENAVAKAKARIFQEELNVAWEFGLEAEEKLTEATKENTRATTDAEAAAAKFERELTAAGREAILFSDATDQATRRGEALQAQLEFTKSALRDLISAGLEEGKAIDAILSEDDALLLQQRLLDLRNDFELFKQHQLDLAFQLSSVWQRWNEEMLVITQSQTNAISTFRDEGLLAFHTLSSGIGKSTAQALVHGKSFSKGMVAAVQGMATQFIAALVDIIIQMVIFKLIGQRTSRDLADSNISSAAARTYAAAYASVIENVPYPANLFLAPAVAAAQGAAVTAGAIAFMSSGAVKSGVDVGTTASEVSDVSAVGLQHGGLVRAPTLTVLGEGAEPELVTPLSKLGKMVGAPTRQQIVVMLDGEVLTRKVVEGMPAEVSLHAGTL